MVHPMTKLNVIHSDQLRELVEVEKIIAEYDNVVSVQTEETVTYKNKNFPIYSLALGSKDPAAPCILFVGGVHGLERVGSQIVVSYMRTICELAKWDRTFQRQLQDVRVLFYPIVNPGGMYGKTRSNPNGIDLMRNAPISADKSEVFPIIGGHRISSKLPWYRGEENTPMEKEAIALCRYVEREVFPSQLAISIDVHSGFGLKDRLWFPYAKTKQPFEKIASIYKLKQLLDRTYPSHVYQVEPQSLNYVTHGDLWDYLYEGHSKKHASSHFFPLALELGSWIWVKKNPRQIFTPSGAFNPMLPHRKKRAFRRHIVLFDFLTKAISSGEHWATHSFEESNLLTSEAMAHWYDDKAKR